MRRYVKLVLFHCVLDALLIIAQKALQDEKKLKQEAIKNFKALPTRLGEPQSQLGKLSLTDCRCK